MSYIIKLGILIISVLLMAISSCKQQTADGFRLKGTIKGIDSGMVKLIRYNDDRTNKTLDSVPLKNGTFELTGSLSAPEMLGILISPGNLGFQIFTENSSININADTSGAEHYDYTAYGMDKGSNLKKVEIVGSSSQDLLDSFENDPEQLKFNGVFADLNKKYYAEKDPGIKERMRTKFDSVGKLSNAWQIKWIRDYVTKNPSSSVGAYIYNNYYRNSQGTSLSDMDVMINKFTGLAKKTSYYGGLVKESNLRKALLPGKVSPDFTLLKRDSTKFTLSTTRGKYIMLDFWASWCKPCREAIPNWKMVYQKYHSKGFEIVSVSDDSKWSDWTKAMDFEKMPWTQVIDVFPVKNMPAQVGTLYQTHFIPFYVLIDKAGKILVYTDNEKEIENKLSEIFQ